MTPKTKRGAKTRKSMLDEATKLFSERGFEGTSTRDISEAVGISLPSIIHFFGSKQGLYEAVVEDIAKQLEEKVCAASALALRTASGRTTRLAKLKALDHLLSTLTRTLLSNPPEWATIAVARAAPCFERRSFHQPVYQRPCDRAAVTIDRWSSQAARRKHSGAFGGIHAARRNRGLPHQSNLALCDPSWPGVPERDG